MLRGRRVFFSFHYERDAWRAAQVRNSQQFPVKGAVAAGRFSDAVDWESIKRQGRQAIQNWINNQLYGTSVTVVLIGTETSEREWVKYEIEQSIARGNGLLGVRIYGISDSLGKTSPVGSDPALLVQNRYPIYDWVWNDGRTNLGAWIETAATAANR